MRFARYARAAARLWRAEPREQWHSLNALGAVAAVRAGLRVTSLRTLASVIGVRVGEAPSAAVLSTSPEVLAAARHVRSVLALWPSESPCLVGALAAGCLLRGRNPSLVVGVRGRAPHIAAHAWLELDGARVPITAADNAADFVVLRRAQEA